MDLQLTNSSESVSVSDAIFARDYSEALVHQLVTAYMAAGRSGTKAQKTRSEVSGGGAKPWRQKGTGRARAGTIRSPIWRSGGITFAAKPRDYSQKLNKKMYRAGISSILSELVRQERLEVHSEYTLDAPKTKDLVAKLGGVESPTLIVTNDVAENLYLASRNIVNVNVLDVAALNPVDLVRYEKVIVTTDALRAIEEWLS